MKTELRKAVEAWRSVRVDDIREATEKALDLINYNAQCGRCEVQLTGFDLGTKYMAGEYAIREAVRDRLVNTYELDAKMVRVPRQDPARFRESGDGEWRQFGGASYTEAVIHVQW